MYYEVDPSDFDRKPPPLETDVACDKGYAVYLVRLTEKEVGWRVADSDFIPAVTHCHPLPTFTLTEN